MPLAAREIEAKCNAEYAACIAAVSLGWRDGEQRLMLPRHPLLTQSDPRQEEVELQTLDSKIPYEIFP